MTAAWVAVLNCARVASSAPHRFACVRRGQTQPLTAALESPPRASGGYLAIGARRHDQRLPVRRGRPVSPTLQHTAPTCNAHLQQPLQPRVSPTLQAPPCKPHLASTPHDARRGRLCPTHVPDPCTRHLRSHGTLVWARAWLCVRVCMRVCVYVCARACAFVQVPGGDAQQGHHERHQRRRPGNGQRHVRYRGRCTRLRLAQGLVHVPHRLRGHRRGRPCGKPSRTSYAATHPIHPPGSRARAHATSRPRGLLPGPPPRTCAPSVAWCCPPWLSCRPFLPGPRACTPPPVFAHGAWRAYASIELP